MPEVALERAKVWRETLTKKGGPEWASTLRALDELIKRAEVLQQKNALVNATTAK
jgi:hypothetical protein